uniref:Uncharacterized protein n=1 Tax=Angiostrongylus cantonensis TaxID=6313 RepID=A0A0K0DIV2_ANGCA
MELSLNTTSLMFTQALVTAFIPEKALSETTASDVAPKVHKNMKIKEEEEEEEEEEKEEKGNEEEEEDF